MKSLLVICLVLLFFTGCGYKNIQDIKKTDVNNLDKKWEYKATSTTVPEMIDIESFTNLKAYLKEVEEQNLDLKSLIITIKAFNKKQKAIKATRKPNASFSLNAEKNRSNNEENETDTELIANLNISWSLDLWGKFSDEIEVAKLEQEQENFNYLHTKRVLFYDAILLWIDLASIEQKLELNSRIQTIYTNLIQIAKDEFIKGLSSKENYISYKDVVNKLNIIKEEFLLNKQIVIFQLNILRAKAPNSYLDIKTKDLMKMNISLPSTLQTIMLYERYDILSAYKDLEILNKQTKASYKALLPQITLSTNATKTKAVKNFGSTDTLWQLVGGITQPIFNSGQLEAIAKAKSLEGKISLQKYKKIVLNALKELETNLIEKSNFERRYKILQNNLKLKEEKKNSSKDGYLNASKSLHEYLLEKISLLELQEQIKEFEKEYLKNKINLALIVAYKFEDLLKNK